MSREEAIKILNQAIAGIQTTRQGHDLLAKALGTLANPPCPVENISKETKVDEEK